MQELDSKEREEKSLAYWGSIEKVRPSVKLPPWLQEKLLVGNSSHSAKNNYLAACNKLPEFPESSGSSTDFAWKSIVDKNVLDSGNLLQDFLNSELHTAGEEPAFVIADFNVNTNKISVSNRDPLKVMKPIDNAGDARELMKKSICALLLHEGFTVSKSSTLAALEELLKDFIKNVGVQLAIAVEGTSDKEVSVDNLENILHNVGITNGIEDIVCFYQDKVLRHKIFLEATISRAIQLKESKTLTG